MTLKKKKLGGINSKTIHTYSCVCMVKLMCVWYHPHTYMYVHIPMNVCLYAYTHKKTPQNTMKTIVAVSINGMELRMRKKNP